MIERLEALGYVVLSPDEMSCDTCPWRDALIEQRIAFKFSRPFQVYLRYIEPNPGREVIYVRGRNKNRLKAHRGSGVDITVVGSAVGVGAAVAVATARGWGSVWLQPAASSKTGAGWRPHGGFPGGTA